MMSMRPTLSTPVSCDVHEGVLQHALHAFLQGQAGAITQHIGPTSQGRVGTLDGAVVNRKHVVLCASFTNGACISFSFAGCLAASASFRLKSFFSSYSSHRSRP